MTAPDFIRTTTAVGAPSAPLWFRITADALRKRGAVFFRASFNEKNGRLYFEGWKVWPDDQGPSPVERHAHVMHGPHDHKDPDDSDTCTACVLSLCVVCGGAEASMPTECPGEKMTVEQSDAVQAGMLDFKDGKWADK